MPDITGISGVAAANIAKRSGQLKAEIAGLSSIGESKLSFPSSGPSILTDDLQIWWDPHDGADSTNYISGGGYAGLTLKNKAAHDGYSDNGGFSTTMYGDHRLLNGATSAFTTLNGRGVVSLDGTNDTILTRCYQNSTVHNWTNPTGYESDWSLYHWKDQSHSSGTGWTTELWFKRNGAWAYNANIMSTYNEAFRFRVQSNKLVGVGMKIGSSTWTTNIDMNTDNWRHMVVTFDPSASSNHMKIYMDGSLAVQRSGTSGISSSTWIRGTLLIGAYQTNGSERAKMYVGAYRMYSVPISSTDVSTNYNAEKGNYGIS